MENRIRAEVIVEDYEKELARQKREQKLNNICASVIMAIIVAIGIACFLSRPAQQPQSQLRLLSKHPKLAQHPLKCAAHYQSLRITQRTQLQGAYEP
jgi:hypothetical protein